MNYIGIDPGKSGAMAIIFGTGEIELFPMNYNILHIQLQSLRNTECICCLEEVHSMPKQGISSTFSFGVNFGYLQGMLSTFEIPYQLIRPQEWKKEFGLNSDKKKSIDVCRRLFPRVSLLRTERSRKEDDGLAEALLMAEYARRGFPCSK